MAELTRMGTDPSLAGILTSLSACLDVAIAEKDAPEEIASAIIQELGRKPVPAGTLSGIVPSPSLAAPRSIPAASSLPPLPVESVVSGSTLDDIAGQAALCTLCPLHKTRNKIVPGQGNPHPELLFIGEAPGADEDRQGLAFVGEAGQLLTRIIQAMGFTRDEVFIANILKCRPPNNRTPLPEEMAACMPFLKAQIRLLKPRVIVALGATAVRGLLNPSVGITSLRGTWRKWEGLDVMPTFHPSYLLRTPSAKADVWKDMQEVVRFLGRTLPPRKPMS